MAWDAPASDGDSDVDGYIVQWRSGFQSFYGSAAQTRRAELDSPSSLTYTVSGLTNGVEYDVRVRAYNHIGAGQPLDVESVTPSEAVTVVAPDLLVGTPTVSDSSPLTGASVTLRTTVRNQGGAAGATTLRYYRSSDDIISRSDASVGTDAVGALGAGSASAESITLTAPASVGTYYYGACVDAVSGESAGTNNCSAAVRVTVGAAPAPDLVVGAPTVSSSSPLTVASFTLSARVRNRGGGAAGATTLRYYRSSDDIISTSDASVGTDAVGALGAGSASAESITLTAPAAAGIYYYGACVDAVSGESAGTNNCSTAVRVTVGVPPDLVVDRPTVSDSSPLAGTFFTLSARVRNRGGSTAVSTTLRYFRSTVDTPVGTDPVGVLGAGDYSPESITLTAPTSAGTYYYGACVEAVSGESDTANNCSVGVRVTVTAPDLVVEAPTVSASSPVAGASFRLRARVHNQGDGAMRPGVFLRFYRSTDDTITAGDTSVGRSPVGVLGAGDVSSEVAFLTAPTSAGTYYYGPAWTRRRMSPTRLTTAQRR